MDRYELAARIQMWIEYRKSRLAWWYENQLIRYRPDPLYWVYTSIDREVIVLTYATFVVLIPTLLSSNGHILPAVLTALFGTGVTRLLRIGRRKRRKEDLIDKVKEELKNEDWRRC
ncbi:hypothetical protein [Natrinema salaciae]|uniref:Uncharacterized protein n=1 Tax=Natrinema salaciae TaxID=1186196 RepID=A0A1H9PS72_9EURY|nr:hypothetical protein [Natrinema salaciae]SER50960.1 hypothetical protein SAMN04489841_3957 [Natrinema salaciae]